MADELNQSNNIFGFGQSGESIFNVSNNSVVDYNDIPHREELMQADKLLQMGDTDFEDSPDYYDFTDYIPVQLFDSIQAERNERNKYQEIGIGRTIFGYS